MNEFVIHSCEQILRFTRAEKWGDLSEERKVQLGFNLGAAVMALGWTKADGFLALNAAREGRITMPAFHEHLSMLIRAHKVPVDKANIMKLF